MKKFIDLEQTLLIDGPGGQYGLIPANDNIAFTKTTSFTVSIPFFPVESDAINVVLSNGILEVGFDLTNGVYVVLWANEIHHNVALKVGSYYKLDIVFDAALLQVRVYLNSLPIFSFDYTGPDFSFATQATYVGRLWNNAAYRSKIMTNSIIFQRGCLDRWDGSVNMADIDTMCVKGNFVPKRRHKDVVAHYALQDTPEGAKLMDCTSQYNYAKELFSPIIHSNTTDLPDWNKSSGITFNVPGELTFSSDGTTFKAINKPGILIAGHKYKIRFRIVGRTGSAAIYPLIGGTAYSPLVSDTGFHEVVAVSATGALESYLYFWAEYSGVAGSITIADVTVTSLSHGALEDVPIELNGYSDTVLGSTTVDTTTNLIPNGDFSSGATNWAVQSNWTVNSGTNSATVANGNGNGNGWMYTTFTLTPGLYNFQTEVFGYTAGYASIFTFDSGNGKYGAIGGALFGNGWVKGTIEVVGTLTLYVTSDSAAYFSVRNIKATRHPDFNKVNQTALRSIYDKQPIKQYALGEGVNTVLAVDGLLKKPTTGLPVLKGAIKLPLYNDGAFQVPSLNFGVGAFSFMLQYYIENDMPTYGDTGVYPNNSQGLFADQLLYLAMSNFELTIDSRRFYATLSNSALAYIELDWEALFKKGAHQIIFVKEGKNVWLFGDNRSVDISNLGASLPPGQLNAEAADFNMITPSYHEIYNGGPDLRLVSYGVKKSAVTYKEALELYANGRFEAPKDVAAWGFYTQFNLADAASFTELSGNSTNMPNPYYGTNKANPAHADYAVKSLATLRNLI